MLAAGYLVVKLSPAAAETTTYAGARLEKKKEILLILLLTSQKRPSNRAEVKKTKGIFSLFRLLMSVLFQFTF